MIYRTQISEVAVYDLKETKILLKRKNSLIYHNIKKVLSRLLFRNQVPRNKKKKNKQTNKPRKISTVYLMHLRSYF